MIDVDKSYKQDGNLDRHKLSQKEKDANNKAWYKYHIDNINNNSFNRSFMFNLHNEYKNMKVNYDLYNNRLNKEDFNYICKPYGDQLGELPAELTNRDIISRKIKYLEGIELKRPFSWNILATNEEATTRKETLKFQKIQKFVIDSIMSDIRHQIEISHQEELQNKKLTPEEKQKLKEQIEQEIAANTPEETKKYLTRKHQDPAEVLARQLLNYLILKESAPAKFAKGWKHSCISSKAIYYVGIQGGEPKFNVINPLRFDCGRSTDNEYIEDAEWASCEYEMTRSEIVSAFKDELTDNELDEIYMNNSLLYGNSVNMDFTNDIFDNYNRNTLRVLHVVFKSLRKIGFLKYINQETQQEEELLIDENYTLDKKNGDISIEWKWIPELHEGYKIGEHIYIGMQPLQGQHKDLTDLYTCKLPYKGVVFDNMNSISTSIFDRLKSYQYYYNIVVDRIELLLASDKVKILLLNKILIPQSQGIDLNKWLYYTEALKIGFLNPAEEGNKNVNNTDITNVAKQIDMSLASDIQKYINFADYLEAKAGESVGIPKQTEGQQSPYETASNVQSSLIQSSHILEPYFQLHDEVKKQVLTGLLEAAKVAYGFNPPEFLSYILDDNTVELLKIDSDLLLNSTYGLFVNNSSTSLRIKQAIEQLSHAALQNQQADLADVIKIMRSDSVQEAEELLEVAAEKKMEQQLQQQEQQQKVQADMEAKQREHEQLMWKHEADMIVLKEEERRKTEIQKQAMLSMGFDPNKDQDNDGVPDVLEVAKFGVDAEIKKSRLEIDKNKLELEAKKHADKVKIEKMKIEASKKK